MASIIRRTYIATLPDGRRVTKLCEHWTIQYRDAAGKIRRVRGYKDKAATKQLAAKLERNLARGEQAMIDPHREHKARPIKEHIAEYVADLIASGSDDKYASNVKHRLGILATECDWKTLAGVEPNSFIRWREGRRTQSHRGARADRKGTSATTLNQYLETARAFLNWCADKRRIEGVAKDGEHMMSTLLSGIGKVYGEKVRKRRGLTDEEVSRLLAAASPERAIVYRVALAMGLRRQELQDLKWGDVRFASIPPYIQLRAEATKARRADKVYFPQTLAADLLKLKPADAAETAAVFQSVPSLEWWKKDLTAAKVEWADAMGRQADFHGGTRKTLCTRMHRAGVPLVKAMRIMRHTDARLTMVDYADDAQLGMEGMLTEIVAAPQIEAASVATGA